jgi:hypothetical protein
MNAVDNNNITRLDMEGQLDARLYVPGSVFHLRLVPASGGEQGLDWMQKNKNNITTIQL